MIQVPFQLFFVLVMACPAAVLLFVWLWRGIHMQRILEKSGPVGVSIDRFRQCPYCGHAFIPPVGYKQLISCPSCKSYIE